MFLCITHNPWVIRVPRGFYLVLLIAVCGLLDSSLSVRRDWLCVVWLCRWKALNDWTHSLSPHQLLLLRNTVWTSPSPRCVSSASEAEMVDWTGFPFALNSKRCVFGVCSYVVKSHFLVRVAACGVTWPRWLSAVLFFFAKSQFIWSKERRGKEGLRGRGERKEKLRRELWLRFFKCQQGWEARNRLQFYLSHVYPRCTQHRGLGCRLPSRRGRLVETENHDPFGMIIYFKRVFVSSCLVQLPLI